MSKAFYTSIIGLTLLFRSSQWSSDNDSPQNFDSDHYSDSSKDCLKEFELESELDEDDLLEACSCCCYEKACDSEIDENDLKTVYVGIEQSDSLHVKVN